MPPPPSPGHAERVRSLLATERRTAGRPAFRCDVHRDAETVTLLPAGELDAATAPLLGAELRAAARHGRRTVVDLRGLAFIDSAGIEALIRAAVDASGRGREFRVIPGPDRVLLAARLTRVLALLGFADVSDAA